MSYVESAKKFAAYSAVDEFLKDGMIVGIGSGTTVVHAVDRIQQRVKQEKLSIKCVPTSFQATQLIIERELELSDLSRTPFLDLAIDGADEVDENLNLIKGGGGCLTQEKIIASNAKIFIVCADYRKDSKILGEKWNKGVPVEVVPLAYVPIMKRIERELNGKPTLRMATQKAGPVVTDLGNFILDVDFGQITDPQQLEQKLNNIPGVVANGLFVNMTEKVFFGMQDGTVVSVDKTGKRSTVSQ